MSNPILNNSMQSSRPIIPWIGGKRRLAKHLLPLFGAHQCYVEPFCGAAALFFMKAPAKAEVINDINGDLINLYRVVQHHLDEFVRQFRWSLVSRQLWQWLNVTPTQPLTDIQRAVRFFYLQKCGFGGKVDGRTFGTATTSGPRLNLLRIEEELSQAHLRLAVPPSSTCPGPNASVATIARTPCSTATHPTGEQKATASTSALSNTTN